MAELNQNENKSTYEFKRTHRIGEKEYPLTPRIGEDQNWILLTEAASMMGEKLSKVRKISSDQNWEKKYDMDPKSNGRNMFTYVKKDDAVNYRNSKLQAQPTEDNLNSSTTKEGGDRLSSDQLPSNSREIEQIKNIQLNTLSKILEDVPSLKNNMKLLADGMIELHDDIRKINQTMQNNISRAIEQGIDLKEKYLEDRMRRTDIEKMQAESFAKQSEALVSLEKHQAESLAKQSEALIELSKRIDQKKPGNNSGLLIILSLGFVALVVLGWGAFYFFTTNQQKMENQFDERLAQERQIQQDQFQQTIKQLKESLIPASNAVVNSTVPVQSAQGTK